MKRYKLLAVGLIFVFAGNYVFPQSKNNLSIDTNIAKKITDNFMLLFPDSVCYKTEAKSKRWNYEQGIVLDAIYRMYKQTGEKKYLDYVKKNMDYYILNDGSISTYSMKEFNLDNVTPGRALLELYNETKDIKYKKAADTLREQLNQHPRTKEGGFWHKEIYPYQVWLDGLYMAQPFYAMYSSVYNDTSAFNDITTQFINIYKHAEDTNTGLLYHAWDESKMQKWANRTTGNSPNFWGRAIGWYMMALVDVLDYIPRDHPNRNKIIGILNSLSESVLKYRDPETKLWNQIVDKPDDKRNYNEASASLMFIYTFAKGVNNGYLNVKYFTSASESFNGVIKNLVSSEDGNIFNLNKVCKVSGLGGKPYRDGSLDYYFSEPVRTNDFKGYCPFILASLEIAKNLSSGQRNIGNGKTIGLDYYFNHEFKNGKRFHYTWEDEAFSGFSELGNIIKYYGAAKKSVLTAPSKQTLDSISVYIIVDPDTPAETKSPNYVNENDINSIEEWVHKGGVLVLMLNDSANCEFTHINKLAEKFGIHFNEDSWNRVVDNKFEMGAFKDLPDHPLFNDVKKLYLKEISSINLTGSAKPVLQRDGKVFMASVNYGNGFVFAVGDPWLYNEYIDNRKLPMDFTNYPVAKNLIKWLLEKAKK